MELEKISKLLTRTFTQGAWHGPSVMEVIQDVTPEIANKRLPQTHSIIELVTHITSWRVFVTKRLEGDNDYKVTDELNFPKETNWKVALENLEQSQENLLEAVKNFDTSKLYELVPHASHKYTYYTLLHGIIHHDLYHAGQIALIKKAQV